MIYCKSCIMPTTRPGTKLNNEGVCLACTNYNNRKNIDWNEKLKELRTLLLLGNTSKHGEYACAIPVSGGKDSHYLVWLVQELGIKTPLLIRVGDGFGISEVGQHNIKNLSDRFGCNMIEYTPSIEWYREIIRKQFEELGNFPIVDQLIYTIPYNICAYMNIPILLYGEDSSYEYGTSEMPVNAGDYVASMFKQSSIKPIKSNYFTTVLYASHYVPWDGRKNYELAKKYGFKELEWNRKGYVENYDSLDLLGWGVSNFLKYRKFGFGRSTDILSRWIRAGYIDRDKALEMANIHDGGLDPIILEDFLRFTRYKENEFWNIVDKWTNREIFTNKDT